MSELRAPLRLFNTLTRTVEPFAPADGVTVKVSMAKLALTVQSALMAAMV